MDYNSILEQAHTYGQNNFQNASPQHLAAFANSVAYLVTGASGGYGGPSMREHAVSWSLAGDGDNTLINTNLGPLTMQTPDGRLPRAGNWKFDKACEFAAPICFNEVLPAICKKIEKQEHCFDDDPNDLRQL